MRFPATVMPRAGGASSRYCSAGSWGCGRYAAFAGCFSSLLDVAGQDRLAVLAERAQLLDEVAHRGALADFLRIVGGEHDA